MVRKLPLRVWESLSLFKSNRLERASSGLGGRTPWHRNLEAKAVAIFLEPRVSGHDFLRSYVGVAAAEVGVENYPSSRTRRVEKLAISANVRGAYSRSISIFWSSSSRGLCLTARLSSDAA